MADEKAQEFIAKSAPVDASAYQANFGAHREGMTVKDVAEYYSKWAESGKYEQDLAPGRYNGPTIAANALAECFPENRQNVKILDIAAGTGFLGEELVKKGFKDIDGLDPAEGMLAACRKKNIYTRLICDFMPLENKSNVSPDMYDCCVIAGGMGEGHIPCIALHEMVRMTKPGGLVVIVMREEYLSYVEDYKDKLEPLMEDIADDGKWEVVSRKVVPSYSFNKNGVVFVFRKL